MRATFTGFLIGLLVVSSMAAIFGMFIIQAALPYGASVSGIDLTKYDKFNETYASVDTLSSNTTSIKQPEGPLDVFSGLLFNTYKVLIQIPQSFGLFTELATNGVNDLHLSYGADRILATILAIVTVLFTMMVLAVLLKRDEI
jgi:hypothetical protein